MAIDVGASVVSGYDSSGSTTTDPITTAASGSSFLIAVVYEAGATEPTISDSKGNTYTRIGSVRQVSTTFSAYAALYLKENGTGGSGHTFTAAKTDSYPTVFGIEITGGVLSGLLDQNNGAALDTSSPIASGSITTTQADELLIGFTGTAQNGTGVFTPGNSFVTVQSLGDASFWTGNVAKRVVASTGTYESNCAITNLLQGAALVASFKAAGSGASAITAAAGAATASALTGRSSARSTATAGAGVATASSLTGRSTAVAALTAAGGAATTSTLSGESDGTSAITPAAGVATAGTLTGRSTAIATPATAAGAATASALAGESTAVAAITPAAGVATASTLVPVSEASAITPAAGVATTSTLVGRSTAVSHMGSLPTLGDHTLLGIEEGEGTDPETTAPIDTQPTGSSLVTFTAGYADNTGGPTDSEGNTWASAGTEVYDGWAGVFDVRGYYVEQAAGGDDHTVTFQADGTPAGEMTVPFIEIRNAGRLVDLAQNYPLAGSALTSGNVTTTGPALLVAFWWGDAGGLNHTAVPNNGFSVVESFLTLPPNSAVQCAVAVRQVTAPGTYNVTWTETPNQGAPLWLFAFESADSGADGAGSSSTIVGRALRIAVPSAAAGAATAGTLAGSSTAVAAATAAAGAGTAGTLAGSSEAVATATAAAGVASASALSGSSEAVAALTEAAGSAVGATLVGRSTAVASPTAAAGAGTSSTLVGEGTADGTAAIAPAAGVATTGTLAGSSVVVAQIVPSSGHATTGVLEGSDAATPAPVGPTTFVVSGVSLRDRKRHRDLWRKRRKDDDEAAHPQIALVFATPCEGVAETAVRVRMEPEQARRISSERLLRLNPEEARDASPSARVA